MVSHFKPNSNVPELAGSDTKAYVALWDAAGKPPEFDLEGLAQGKLDRGFLYQGVLFRLISQV